MNFDPTQTGSKVIHILIAQEGEAETKANSWSGDRALHGVFPINIETGLLTRIP